MLGGGVRATLAAPALPRTGRGRGRGGSRWRGLLRSISAPNAKSQFSSFKNSPPPPKAGSAIKGDSIANIHQSNGCERNNPPHLKPEQTTKYAGEYAGETCVENIRNCKRANIDTRKKTVHFRRGGEMWTKRVKNAEKKKRANPIRHYIMF